MSQSIEGFRAFAASWLRNRGCYDEDVLSEMVLDALEYPNKFLSVEYVYQHALDRLDPRVRIGTTRRHISTYTQRLTEAHTACLSAPPAHEEISLEAFSHLTSREQWVLTEHFWEGRTFADIGASLGVSEARAWQIASKAIATLGVMYVRWK